MKDCKPLNILVDHSGSYNAGDLWMLWNNLKFLGSNRHIRCHLIKPEVTLKAGDPENEPEYVRTADRLLAMPHWRLREYKNQKGLYKIFAVFVHWQILFMRFAVIYLGVIFFRRFRFIFPCSGELRFWIKSLSEFDGYWVTGGGNLNDIWIEKAFWKMAFARIFRMQKKPVIFSGQGIGPLQDSLSIKIIRWGAKAIDFLSLRERESLKIMRTHGIESRSFRVVCDDALYDDRKTLPKISSAPGKFIALNYRDSSYTGGRPDQLHAYIQLIGHLAESYPDAPLLFIPVALNPGESDVKTAKRIINKLDGSLRRKTRVYEPDGMGLDIRYVFKNALASVGVSYHFCLFSLDAGVPTVGLYGNGYYNQKISGLMDMFGCVGCALDLAVDDVQELNRAVKKGLDSFDREKVEERKKLMVKDWEDQMRVMIESLGADRE